MRLLPPDHAKDYVLCIGVETYRRSAAMKSVKYAENDANGIADAFLNLGVPEENIERLLSADATLASVRTSIKAILERAAPGDRVIISYAGHGYSNGDWNYLSAYDTDPRDLLETCIRLQWLLGLAKQSPCEQVLILLDACHTGAVIEESMRSAVLDFDPEAEFRDQYCLGLASCGPGQKSYPLDDYEHGIWSYHLLKALRGEAPQVLDERGVVVVSDLQAYLLERVRETAQGHLGKQQTPRMFGSMEVPVAVADLTSLRETQAVEAPELDLSSLTLRSQDAYAVRRLSGFKKGYHHVPTDTEDYSVRFVARIARQELADAASVVYGRIRELGYRRREIDDLEVEDGRGFRTADFEYSLTVALEDDEPSTAIVVHEISGLASPSFLMSEDFNAAFDYFTEISISARGKAINLEEINDAVEDLEDEGFKAEIPYGEDRCEIRLSGTDDYHIVLEPHELVMTARFKGSPGPLAQAGARVISELQRVGVGKKFLPKAPAKKLQE